MKNRNEDMGVYDFEESQLDEAVRELRTYMEGGNSYARSIASSEVGGWFLRHPRSLAYTTLAVISLVLMIAPSGGAGLVVVAAIAIYMTGRAKLWNMVVWVFLLGIIGPELFKTVDSLGPVTPILVVLAAYAWVRYHLRGNRIKVTIDRSTKRKLDSLR